MQTKQNKKTTDTKKKKKKRKLENQLASSSKHRLEFLDLCIIKKCGLLNQH